MRDLLPCPPCGRQGRPGQGTWQARILEPRGSAPRERDHRGGDHPVPSRTRQLSPPSPRVLQREAAGGQGVALAEGAFLCLRGSAREEMCGGAPHAPGEARRGIALAGLFASWAALSGGAPRIAEGPSPQRLGSRRRAPALVGPFDCGRPCIMPLQARNGGALSRALPAFWGGRAVASGAAPARGAPSRRWPSAWRACSRHAPRFSVGPRCGPSCLNGGLVI